MHLYLLGIATIQVKHILLDALKLLAHGGCEKKV